MQREVRGVSFPDAGPRPFGLPERFAERATAPAAEVIQRARSYRPSRYERWFKPILDFIGAIALTILTVPVLVIGVVAVWLTLGRPALYRQPRVGRQGKVFDVFKLRTMLPDRRYQDLPYVGPERRFAHKRDDDPRHTRVGLYLRRFKLDELPQLWNVLRGEMSLVGPRPELVSVVEDKYEAWQHLRHNVKPGLTGPWQIAPHLDGLMYLDTRLDLEYVAEVSLSKDLRILLATPGAALGVRREH